MRRRRNPEIIAGRVNADGSIAAGDGFTVQKTAVGVYALTFAPGFRVVSLSAVPVLQPVFLGANPAASPCTVSALSSAGSPGDFAFTFTAVGVQQ
jgi:hypothetical protein